MKWIFIFFHSLDQLFPPSTATLFLFHSTTFTLVPSFLTPSSLPTSLRPYIPHLLHRISCPLPNPITPSSSLHSTSRLIQCPPTLTFTFIIRLSIFLQPSLCSPYLLSSSLHSQIHLHLSFITLFPPCPSIFSDICVCTY
uniref:Uncharacterized protein n=1 Tax=Cacopsylla melanoneura TaxID=428564 RepID=A0A8D8Z9E6_9HEMI